MLLQGMPHPVVVILHEDVVSLIGAEAFGLVLRTAIFSFIISFGLVKALSNLVSGTLADRYGRKAVLVAGWFVELPVPFMIMLAPSWNWIVAANMLLLVDDGHHEGRPCGAAGACGISSRRFA